MRILITAMFAAIVCALPAAGALAGGNPSGTGQPNQSCQAQPTEPGHAALARGSAFNEPSAANPLGGIAGQMYAGNGQNTNTPANGHAVAQYDVACYQVSQH
jgi:hypothetical protein